MAFLLTILFMAHFEAFEWVNNLHHMTNQDFLSALGANIKEQRQKQQITISKLAEMCSMSDQSLTSIERGKTATHVDNLNRIANALNVQPHELLMFNQSTGIATSNPIHVDGATPITINLCIRIS